MSRRACHVHVGWVLFGALLIATVGSAPVAMAQQFPAKDITWIVPYAPGGGFDAWARAMGQAMKKELPGDVKVVVKNLPGAAGRVGTIQLYRAKPDGYTIGSMDVPGLVAYQIAVGSDKAGYDVDRFAWIGFYAESPFVVTVKKGSPLRSMKEIKQQGARLRWGVQGPGDTHWLGALIVTGELGLPLNIVSGYKGAAEIAPALMRGDFEVATMLATTILEYVKSGDLEVITTIADERFPAFPGVPTTREQGFSITVPFVRLATAPPGTPAGVVKQLEGMLLGALKDPELRRWAEATGRALEITRPGGAEAARRAITELAGITKKYEKEIAAAIKVGR